MPATASEFRPARNRYLYPVAAALVLLVVFIGFAPSFFLKGHLGPARELSLVVRTHGGVMTAWFVLLLVQALLIFWKRPAAHRVLGLAGGPLAAAVFLLASTVQLNATRDERARLGTLHVEGAAIGFLLLFLILVGLALAWRKRPEIHQRLMLVATISLLGAAWGRFPFEFVRQHSDFFTNGGLVAFVAADTWIHRRLHPACLWGTIPVLAANYALGFL